MSRKPPWSSSPGRDPSVLGNRPPKRREVPLHLLGYAEPLEHFQIKIRGVDTRGLKFKNKDLEPRDQRGTAPGLQCILTPESSASQVERGLGLSSRPWRVNNCNTQP